VYTICLHPNECEEKNIEMLKSFLKRYHTLCVPWEDIAGGTYHNSGMRRCEHLFFMYAKIIKNKLTRFVK
ncbi:MAG: hypothetical protein N2Z76_01310, partial [Treponemataceae bacterium]|nr:hypothetical protein [Treponemataceae bacterium]